MASRQPGYRENRTSPVMQLGIIPGKYMPDNYLIDLFEANSTNPRVAVECYPGNAARENVYPNIADCIYGERGVRGNAIEDGEPVEEGIVAINGLRWRSYKSQQDMERRFYWIGIVTTPSREVDPRDGVQGDPPHGGATAKVGQFTIKNTGRKTIYAGDLVVWKFPNAPFHPRAAADYIDYESSGPQYNDTNGRWGTPPTQWVPELEPYDPTDYCVEQAGAFACIQAPQDAGGICDIPFEEVIPQPGHCAAYAASPYAAEQDVAIALKFGLVGVALTIIKTLIRNRVLTLGDNNGTVSATQAHQDALEVAQRMGLFQHDCTTEEAAAGEGELVIEALADVLLDGISNGDPFRTAAIARFREESGGASLYAVRTSYPQNNADRFRLLTAHAMQILMQSIIGVHDFKREKIVGKALNSCGAGQDLHFLAGHTPA